MTKPSRAHLVEMGEQISRHLNSLPQAKPELCLNYEQEFSKLSHVEEFISRLKTSIQFLSKLNPMEYIRWMQDAFAHYTRPTNPPMASAFTEDEQHSTYADVAITVRQNPTRKNSKEKSNRFKLF